MPINTLTTVFIVNILGIMLLLTLFLSNQHRLYDDKDEKIIFRMMMITLFACIVDPIVFYSDGKPGLIYTIIIYIGSIYIYFANIAIGYTWVNFITSHLSIPFSNKRKIIYFGMAVFSVLCLIANLFYPFVFEVNDNVYKRGVGYWIFLAICAIEIIDSLYLYVKSHNKIGILKFFPVHVFVLPVIVGIIVQSISYGMSIIWPSVAIAAAGTMTAVKNESIYTDRLTGVYNREYLNYLQQYFYRKEDAYISGIMIDLNGFKQINDNFNHSTGDEALVDTVAILNEAFSECGTVIRFAGDEFIVLLNIADEQVIINLIDHCKQLFDKFNAAGLKPYKLSAAMGYATINVKDHTVEFMNIIDQKMYEDKAKYYNNPEFDRRARQK